MQNKKLSTKASILHRIFLNLKLIQDSTCLDIDSINEDSETNYYGIGTGTELELELELVLVMMLVVINMFNRN